MSVKMEISNSYDNFDNLTILKKEFKTEPEADQNTGLSFSCDLHLPVVKQEFFLIKEEEIDIDWDENCNIYGKVNKLLKESDSETSKLNNGSTVEPNPNEFSQAEKKNCNGKTKKFHKKKNKGKLFDKICKQCKKKSEINIDVCHTCHTRMTFECKVCLKHFNSRHGITRHLDTKCNIQGYYQCSYCDYRSPVRDQIRNHLKRIHHLEGSNYEDKISWKICNNEDDINLYNCSKCEREFGSYRSLSYHLKCCIKIVSNYTQLENEDTILKGSENKNSVKKMAVYYCIKCKKDSKISDFSVRNQNYCLDCRSNLMFKCMKCEKQYGLYSSIVYHLKRMCNPKNTLQCSECDYTAPLISLINKHYRMTHDRQISYCSTCGGKYKNPESLRKHLYNCTRTFYYNCNDCKYKTKIKSRLTRHVTAMHLKKDENEKLISN